MPCGIDDSDLEALRADDASFYGQDSAASDTDSDQEPARAAKRVDHGGEDDDEVFSDVDVPINPGTGAAASPELAAVLDQIQALRTTGCGCATNHYLQFADGQLVSLFSSLSRLSKADKKLFILGELAASLQVASVEESRRKYTFVYSCFGHKICRKSFLAIHNIGQFTLRSLQEQVEAGQVTPAPHKSAGRVAVNVLPPDAAGDIGKFIRSYAATFGMPQPAAPRGRPGLPPVFLPASINKKKLFAEYEKSAEAGTISFETFRRYWQIHAPEVVIMKPRSDVCYICDKHREAIRVSKTEEETQAASSELAEHLQHAHLERAFYNKSIETAKAEHAKPEPNLKHITFDFAQQLEVPQHTRQVGPLYFKSRFRIQLFGVCDEAAQRQINFTFHEGETIGQDGARSHGPNAVISMLDHYLDNYCQERVLAMHADNCVGQNKNRSVIAYLAWRVLVGLSDELSLSFMRVGHTRCSVDGYFGLLKKSFRSNEVDSMADCVKMIDDSCGANEALRFSWSWREWDAFLARFFGPIKGIATYQHFSVTRDAPGQVTMKHYCDGEEDTLRLLKAGISVAEVAEAGKPQVLQPMGISADRLHYLNKEIKQYLHSDSLIPWENEE